MRIVREFLNFVTRDDDVEDSLYYEDYARDFFPTKRITERDLINLESKVGAAIFGAVPRGRRREFFSLNADTWIWHEEWTDEGGELQVQTVRYEVSENGVLKVMPGLQYAKLQGVELDNFRAATGEYLRRVAEKVYRREV